MIEEYQTDKYLIEEYKSGNSAVLSVLVKKWHKVFCEKAFWVLRDKELAKDVAQESWLIIIDKLPDLKNANSFKSWAFRIIYTRAIDAHNRRIKERERRKSVPKRVDDQASSKDNKSIIKKALLKGIQQLPGEKQDIIRLFYVEEYSLNEIIAFLKIPVGTVKSRLFNAREKLKSLIKTMDYEK